MRQTTCPFCGAAVQSGKTKADKSALFDLEPRLHLISCRKWPRKSRPLSHPTREPKALLGDGVDALVSLGMSRQEAQRVKAKDRPALIEALRTAGNNERKV